MNAACGGDGPARTVQSGWTRGFLTSIGGYASAITYHPQGLWKDITRTNGVKDNQTAWQGQGRPGRIYTTGASGGNFDTGLFDYDGAGNIKRMGNDDFGYDQVSRLWYAEAACTGTTAASCHRQQYEYDAAGRGNLFRVTTQPRGGAQSTVQWAMDTNTNRLSSAGYDVAGNMTQSPYHGSLGYDSQDALVRMGPGGDNASRVHAYTASGERAWTVVRVGTNWSQLLWVRGLGEEVLRVYTRTTPPLGGWSVDWNWANDTVWRGGQRLAQVSPSGTRHEHLDHLGTPRLHTNQSGQVTQRLDVYPYGRDTPETSSPAVAFTGHERDNLGTVDGTDDMDYMHARFYSPQMGRFFQVDAINGDPTNPQSWNRYSYVHNNPLYYVDPDGNEAKPYWEWTWDAIKTGGLGAFLLPEAREQINQRILESAQQPIFPGLRQEQGAAVEHAAMMVFPQVGVVRGLHSVRSTGVNVRAAGTISSGRLQGFQRISSELTGGLENAAKTFKGLTGRSPSGQLDRVVLKDEDLEVVFRQTSRSGTPKIEIIKLQEKTLEKITFLP